MSVNESHAIGKRANQNNTNVHVTYVEEYSILTEDYSFT